MGENEQVTSMALRLVIDSYEDILGKGGTNSIFNYVGFTHLINNPPAYDDKKMVPRALINGTIRASIAIIGEVGTKTILMRAGASAIRRLLEHDQDIRALAENPDIPKTEKIRTVLSRYSENVNRLPLFTVTDTKAVYRSPDCMLCYEIKAKKPYCTYIAGVFQEAVRRIAGYPDARCEEVDCKAKGDNECVFEIYYNGLYR